MNRILALLYGVVCYLVFFLTFLYAVGFVGNLVVPKSIDTGTPPSFALALVINLALMTLFAVQHSVMARPGFKQWWTKYLPSSVERSTYVLFSSLALILLFWLWRPMTGTVWHVEAEMARNVIWAVFWLGWGVVLISTFLINHFELFGLQQVYFNFKGRPHVPGQLKTPLFYQFVRHPIMLGFIIAFWATPDMTTGHLLFASVTTAYILIAIRFFEERDLLHYHGEEYAEYQRQVSMIIPMPKRK